MKTANNIETRKSYSRIARRNLPLLQIAGDLFWLLTASQLTISCNYVGPERINLPYRIKLSSQAEAVYQSALASAARMLQPSLIKFLR